MNRFWIPPPPLLHVLVLFVFWVLALPLRAVDWYVAPDGDDAHDGSIEQPFATLQRAQSAASPGDTVFLRGGLYAVSEEQIARYERIWAYVSYLDKSGTPEAPIRYWAYPGERPIFDFSAVKPADRRVTAFFVRGSWLHFKGFEIIGVQVTILEHTQSICIENQGSHNIFEQIVMRDGQAIGIYLTRGSHNLVLNCDAYRNWDYTSQNGLGGNVDGFGGHLRAGGVNNVFRGCRAWFNSDDGFDAINSQEAVVFENCWAFYNGFSPDFERLGDGHGFKSGGHAGTALDRLPDPMPRHVTRFCLAVRNKTSGFYANHQIGGQDWQRNTAVRNPVNFNMLGRLADNATTVPGYGHLMRNNLGALGAVEVSNLDFAASDVEGNSFTLDVVVTEEDFASLDEALLVLPRQADGSLPEIAFARLTRESDLIDAGVDDGFDYAGAAPDLGAFEASAAHAFGPVAWQAGPAGLELEVTAPAGWPVEWWQAANPALPAASWDSLGRGLVGLDGRATLELVPSSVPAFFQLRAD